MKPIFVYFSVVIASFVANFIVLFIAYKQPARLKRQLSATMLVGHLAVVALCFGFVNTLDTGDGIYLVSVDKHLCSFVAYWKNVFSTAFVLTIVVLIYERGESFKERRNPLLVFHLVSGVWVISLFSSFPASAMSKPETEILKSDIYENYISHYSGNCRTVNSFVGTNPPAVLYEILRFFLFHIAVGGYMVYSYFKIRAKYNEAILDAPDNRLRRKTGTVYLVYFHLAYFLLVWTPLSALQFYGRLTNPIPEISTSNQNSERVNRANMYYGALFFSTYFYIILCPLVSLIFLENGFIEWLSSTFCKPDERDGDYGEIRTNDGNREGNRTNGDEENCPCSEMYKDTLNNISRSSGMMFKGEGKRHAEIEMSYWERSKSEGEIRKYSTFGIERTEL